VNKALLTAVLVLTAGAAVVPLSRERTMSGLLDLIDFRSGAEFPPLTGATGWLNSAPLTPTGLRGKVVLVQFWTYSCINWLRTEPYMRAWAEKYGEHGLVVIGVHSPEFGFEKDADNVRWAVKNYRINYPVAIDSDHAIWRAFSNQYWPALYLVDAEGRIRHQQFGEGGYAETERVLQQLLSEAGMRSI
jgi:thiol-disulfide isomerase/thioredoxin